MLVLLRIFSVLEEAAFQLYQDSTKWFFTAFVRAFEEKGQFLFTVCEIPVPRDIFFM